MRLRIATSICLAVSLGACSTLPSSGPTGPQIRQGVLEPVSVAESQLGMELVQVVDAATLPPAPTVPPMRLTDLAPPPTDMVGPGDVLSITIYEAGVALFGGGGGGLASQAAAGFDPSVKAQTLPPSRVDDNGDIIVPYAGRLRVVGKTVGEIQEQIRVSLKGLSQNPQVIVTMNQVITNSVIVSGEVARPGRLVLQTNRETLSDVVALAGGYRGASKDLTLRVFRRDDNVDVRLGDLVDNPAMDVRAYPGDRFMLINNPRSFSVLGASGRVENMPFIRSDISLMEAIATSGGSHPQLGDPKAVFVLRYVADEQGETKPVVYHINMMNTGSYFLAQRFAMRDKDVLYFGNSEANQPSKMIQLISQLFSPIMTVVSVAQVLDNNN
jgi:polysaccharide export outer membrane protein